jgi:hypothetical protein
MPQFGGKNAKNKTSSSSTKRHFTVVIGNKEHGLYVSSSPSSAARKVVSKLCASNKSKKVKFSIREITQGSKKKTYGPYLGHIEKLKEPIELKGRVIKYKPVAKLSGKTGAKKGGMMGGMTYEEWDRKYWSASRYQDNNSKKNAESLQTEYPEYFKRYSFNKEYIKAYTNLDDEKIHSLKASNPQYFEQYLEKQRLNSNKKNEKRYLSKFPIRFQRLIFEGVLKGDSPFSSGSFNSRNSYKIVLPTSPIKNKQELLDFINARSGDSALFINALGIDDKDILEKNAQTVQEAILDKINQYDP